MEIPKGEPIQEKMKISFVDFDRVLDKVMNMNLNGYIRLETTYGLGYAFIRCGEIVFSAFAHEEKFFLGNDAHDLLDKAKEEQGTIIDIYSLDENLVNKTILDIIVQNTEAEKQASDLEINEKALEEFLNEAKKRDFHGYIEITIENLQGIIFFIGGLPTLSYFQTSEILLTHFVAITYIRILLEKKRGKMNVYVTKKPLYMN